MLLHVNLPYAPDQISYCEKAEMAQAYDVQ